LYAHVRKHLLTDSVLFQKWLTLFKVSTKAEYAETSESVDDILCGMIDICINNIEIFDEVVTLFLKVAFSQFRRDYLSYIKKEKGKALRKKVTERSKKCSKAFDMQFLREDKSVGKSVTHLRLKCELINNDKFLLEKSFTKKDLLLLCKAYDLKVAAKKKNDFINSRLVETICKSNSVPFPNELGSSIVSEVSESNVRNVELELSDSDIPTRGTHQESTLSTSAAAEPNTSLNTSAAIDATFVPMTTDTEMPGSSTDTTQSSIRPLDFNSSPSEQPPKEIKKIVKSRKRKTATLCTKKKDKKRGKKTESKETEEDNCGICNRTDVDGEDCICCDSCSLWYHRICVNLEDEKDWKELTENDDANYVCPLCQ